MLEYWESRAVEGVPGRGDIDPLMDVPRLAPDLFMVNVIDGGADFVVRLVGTRVVERYGNDSTGQSIRSLTGGIYRQAILALFRSCVERRRPIHSLTNYLHPDRPHSTVERLMMPLREAGDDVTIVLTIQLFHDAPDLVARPLRQVVEETAEAGDAFRFQAHVVM